MKNSKPPFDWKNYRAKETFRQVFRRHLIEFLDLFSPFFYILLFLFALLLVEFISNNSLFSFPLSPPLMQEHLSPRFMFSIQDFKGV